MKSDIMLPIDKQHLSIDFDELNILQAAMVLPKRSNIIALKNRIPTALSQYEFMQELKNPLSPLSKYVNTMIMTQIARYDILMEEENAREAFIQAAALRGKDTRIIFHQMLRAYLRHHHFIYQEDELASMMRHIQEVSHIKLQDAIVLRHYLLEASRYADLSYYARFADSPAMLTMIHNLINQRYSLADHNFQSLDNFLNRRDLTDAQKDEGRDILERLVRRNELLSSENIEKNLSHINLEDAVVLEQHLKKLIVGEQFYGLMIEREIPVSLKDQPSKVLSLVNINSKSYEVVANKETNKAEPQLHSSVALDEKTKWNYRIYQSRLNDELEKIFDHGAVLTTEFESLLDTVHDLQKLNAGPNDSVLSVKLSSEAARLIETLSDNPKYLDLSQTLSNFRDGINFGKSKLVETPSAKPDWVDIKPLSQEPIVSKNLIPEDEQENYQEVKSLVANMIQDASGEYRQELEKFDQLLKLNLTSEDVQRIELQYSKMGQDFPGEDSLFLLFNQLQSLSCFSELSDSTRNAIAP